MKKRFRGEIAKEIILGLAGITTVVGLTFILAAAPGLGRVIKPLFDWYQKSDKKKRFAIRKTFKDLRRERLIEERDLPDGTTILVLSEKGRREVLRYNIEDLQMPKPHKWDRKWHFVIFDLPKRYVREREFFRSKIKILGFHQVNKSVWVHAFPCRKEIDFVSEYLKISPYVRHIEADDFDGSDNIKPLFNL